ncbi:putative TetR family transcriptional regulator [Caenibius tardaugens NBRC 16725]|uniref:Putative TetR family transcriptional regulator n=1 Tax=Caenibius tardaugens NBRC 16725 TaxID=1219035 RepID=U3A6C9_9SPHN|nr:TetR/AcrR family transcriptional regulator [Caenibius tardaugens]AZI35099.1 TetR/AcrR family transcriptional regulator [Caenibius tardaugens NBRC 16725]GAD50288.1 putative TetR family transcriptional regulator [Caenibius tardaugens NBRC 16725]
MSTSSDNTIAPMGRQAQKSLRTRERLIESTITLIRQGGLAAASAKRIADGAGMTWGAAQHHFGSKEQILEAIVARSHESFVSRFADMDASPPVEERIESFLTRMWAHYRSEAYLATIEIIMADRGPEQENIRLTAFEWPNPDHVEMMTRIFGDRGVSPEELLEALIFVHCLLTGLAIQELLENDTGRLEGHLRRCQRMLASILQAEG